MQRRAAWAVAVGAIAVSVVVLALGTTGSRSLDQRVGEVGDQLGCPTCAGQSVSDSDAPMARSMRSEIRAQLRAGKDEDAVIAWFADRYGEHIVLRPGSRGWGGLLWLAPVGVLLVGAGAVAWARRSTDEGRPDERDAPPRPLPGRRLAAVAVAVAVAGVAVPLALSRSDPSESATGTSAANADRATTEQRSAAEWAALAADLGREERYAEAVSAWREALQSQPESRVLATRLAFDQLRAGLPDEALRTVDDLAARPGRHRALALLVLGLAQHELGHPGAEETLREFLRIEPTHPAAAGVRRLLEP